MVLGGRLLREAVLQQSSLSATDAYCAEEKTAAMVDAVLAVIDRCQVTVAAGVAGHTGRGAGLRAADPRPRGVWTPRHRVRRGTAATRSSPD